jgi:phospholipid/cholesterol/gamma-HCH transport system permease protein
MLTNADSEASTSDAPSANLDPRIEMREEGGVLTCKLSGNWTTRRVASVDKAMRAIPNRSGIRALTVDISAIGRMDTAGAWLIERLVSAVRAKGTETRIQGENEVASILLDAVGAATRKKDDAHLQRRPNILIRALTKVGEGVYEMKNDFVAAMNILGATIRGGQMKHGRGHGINLAAIFNQIDKMGVGAIPVVVLMSAIVGAIVAQQGAYQLSYFGADIFVVDLVGILTLRELGVLMTAIMIAGRSGSAITAEIGSMKMREEVDALTVIGLNPIGVLVFPRLVALVVALPCLTVAANFAALGGGIGVSWFYSDIAPVQFIDRLRAAIDVSTIFAGLIKAPFMALIIGIIGAIEGMKVGGSAESLGQHVTASVVKSIFVVIVLDGMFAMFYAAIDF